MAYPHDRPAWRGEGAGQWSPAAMRADFVRRRLSLARRAATEGLSRREFLAFLAATTAAGGVSAASAARTLAATAPVEAATGAPPEAAAPPPKKSRVVVVTHPEVIIRDYRANLPIVREMLDRGVAELFGRRTEAEAWADVAREGDFVAVKHNQTHAPTLHTHTEINSVLIERLTGRAGVDPKRFLAVDRRLPEPYDELSDPFTLPSRNLTTRLRRLYTEAATAVVNVSVLKTHFDDGLSAALKNHLGSVNNPSAYHGWEPDRMPRSLPELNALPPLRSKTRLVIIDAIRPLYARGPFDDTRYRWDFRGLVVATDPVAADAVGLRILEAQRAKARGQAWPVTAARAMVAWGQEIALGNADPDRIDRVEIDMG
ncbi:MAG: DUF362 domain-containing protein [Phycisphaerae bacterium]